MVFIFKSFKYLFGGVVLIRLIVKLIHHLARNRNYPIIGTVSIGILKMLGLEIPKSVKLGKNIIFAHGAPGLIVHPYTTIRDNVIIFQDVTIGRADSYISYEQSNMKEIVIDEGAMICAGAKILCKSGVLKVGKNTIIGANAVLLKSTGDNEIWAGIPAKKIRDRLTDEF